MTEPFYQGDLDNLCGLYSLVNATAWSLRKSAPLTVRDSNALMRFLVGHLAENGVLPEAINRGTKPPQLYRAAKAAREWLVEHKGINLTIERPFASGRDIYKRTAFATIRQHLKSEHAAAIILIRRRRRHWTVVTNITERNIILQDSEGAERLPLQSCAFGTHSNRDKQKTRIIPDGTLLLSFLALE